MKLYAVKNKTTGELANINGNILTFKSLRLLGEWYADLVSGESLLEERFESLKENEIVRLRIEPIEPCEFCREPDDLIIGRIKPYQENLNPMAVEIEDLDPELCPMCGRSLNLVSIKFHLEDVNG